MVRGEAFVAEVGTTVEETEVVLSRELSGNALARYGAPAHKGNRRFLISPEHVAAVEIYDADECNGTTDTPAESPESPLAAAEERAKDAERRVTAAKAEIAALYAKSMNRAVERDEWRVNALAAEKRVAELEAKLAGRDVKAEALPTREDLETVLRTAFDSGRVRLGADTVLFGERSGLIELNGRFYERDDGTPATFAQAVKVCADLVRAQKAEG